MLAAQFDVDRLNPAAVADERAEPPTDQADNQRTEQRRAETGNIKPVDHTGGHHQQQGVDHEGEQAEGEDVDRQGQDDQDRPEKDVQNSQNQDGNQRGPKTTDLEPGNR